MAAKAKDIAKELGISTATLSLVVNGKPGISKKTREHVISELKRLGYENIIKSEQTETQVQTEQPLSRTIGFIIYKNGGEMLGLNSFYPLILDGVEQTARKFGYILTVMNMERTLLQEQIHYITDSNCIGYVIFATEMQGDEIKYFEKLGIPFVLLDNYYNDQPINSVKVNNEQAVYLAVHHLYDCGHRRIGYLKSGLSIKSFEERYKWANEILNNLGIHNLENYTYTIGYPIDKASAGIKAVLRNHLKDDLPTAFLSDNDLVAIGAMQGMKECGYSIPDDFSLIGNADRPISALVSPKLTTIQIPHERFGAEAVFQLIRQLEAPSSSYTKVEVNGRLICRESIKKL